MVQPKQGRGRRWLRSTHRRGDGGAAGGDAGRATGSTVDGTAGGIGEGEGEGGDGVMRNGEGDVGFLALERLIGPRSYDAYNHDLCNMTADSPVGLLRVWLPTAIVGSRESSVPHDCTHFLMAGATYAFWNQHMMHAVWRREQRSDSIGTGMSAGASAGAHSDTTPAASTGANRITMWHAVRRMLARYTRATNRSGDELEGTFDGVCRVGGPPWGAYIPAPALCVPRPSRRNTTRQPKRVPSEAEKRQQRELLQQAMLARKQLKAEALVCRRRGVCVWQRHALTNCFTPGSCPNNTCHIRTTTLQKVTEPDMELARNRTHAACMSACEAKTDCMAVTVPRVRIKGMPLLCYQRSAVKNVSLCKAEPDHEANMPGQYPRHDTYTRVVG